MTKKATFQKWLKDNPLVLEVYGDLPVSYLQYLFIQSYPKGIID